MKKEAMIDWITEGQVTIPKALLKHYTDIGLNEEECMLLLHVNSFISDGNDFPTPDELSGRTSFSSEECSNLLRTLIHKGVLSLEQHQNASDGLYSESYSLVPLWEKLLLHYFKNQEPVEQESEQLFTLFEQEFGRPLSPLECESFTKWMDEDKHSPALIKAALKEAVMSGKLNFRYIDVILLEWKKNGIQTPEQAKAYGEKFRRFRQRKREEPEKKEPFPFYNWLEK